MTACRKVRYGGRNSAERARLRLGNAALAVYFCRACVAWHLGTDRRLMPFRIDQLLAKAAERDRMKRGG